MEFDLNQVEENNIDEEAGAFHNFHRVVLPFQSDFTAAGADKEYAEWLEETKTKVEEFIMNDDVLKSLFNDNDRKLFKVGKPTETAVKMFAVGWVLDVSLVRTIDKDCNLLNKEGFCEENAGTYGN